MQRRLVLIPVVVLALAGCGGGGDGPVWGGYTEQEAKDILADTNVWRSVIENAPGDPATNPLTQLYPTKEQLDDADLKQVTFEGEENWQYKHPEEDFCLYVREDPEVDNWQVMASRCVAD